MPEVTLRCVLAVHVYHSAVCLKNDVTLCAVSLKSDITLSAVCLKSDVMLCAVCLKSDVTLNAACLKVMPSCALWMSEE